MNWCVRGRLTHLREMGCDDMDCIHLAQDKKEPLAGSCECDNASSGSMKGWEFLEWLSDFGLQQVLCSMEYIFPVLYFGAGRRNYTSV